MIVKFTLCGLIILLILIIMSSYYVNKEGFDDISKGYLSTISNDLSSAINTVSSDISGSSPTVVDNTQIGGTDSTNLPGTTIPTRTDVVPEVSISGSGYNAMNLQQRAELLKDIQKVVRNEVLASRSTTPVLHGETRQKTSDSTAQGQEYENSCYKDTDYRCPKNPDGSCPPIPDMTQYIKKDQIPCWGCSLDY
jgi:hypothetical protein